MMLMVKQEVKSEDRGFSQRNIDYFLFFLLADSYYVAQFNNPNIFKVISRHSPSTSCRFDRRLSFVWIPFVFLPKLQYLGANWPR